ncbi:MAG: nucleoside deaminase [Proteobacteria bacterium]|nr:nucleoside deaminase [Pseudomonadota bacterium]
MMTNEQFMKVAIEKTKEGIFSGQSPFGAVIVKGDNIVAVAHNIVWKTCDPTAHAEVNAIREAAKELKTIDLSGSVMFTTCEPCPMCLSAIHWAKIDKVYYGATIADAAEAGFKELEFPAKELARLGKSPLVVEEGLCREECASLFSLWKNAALSKTY